MSKTSTDALREKYEFLKKKQQELEESNPFWYYKPTSGTVTPDRVEFLSNYLKPEDVPVKLDGQIDAHTSEAPITLALGGNQAGKTVFGIITGIIWATGALPDALVDIYPKIMLPPETGVSIIRVTGVDHKTMLSTLLPAYRHWVPREYLKNGRWKDSFSSENKMLSLYDPSTNRLIGGLEFMTNQQDVDSFQGPPRQGMIYDEEPRRAIYKENLMRMTTAARMKQLFCMTPTHGMSWVYDVMLEDDTDSYEFASVVNPRANMEVLTRILDGVVDYEERKMRLLGKFVSLSGLVYGSLFKPSVHVIEPVELNRRDHCVAVGLDPHLVTPTAMVFMAVDREGNCIVDRCATINGDTDKIKEVFHTTVHENKYRVMWSVSDQAADTTIKVLGGINTYRLLRSGKDAIKGLKTSSSYGGSIKAGVDEIKKRLFVSPITQKPRLFIVNRPENKALIQSFRTMERDTYANEDINGPKDKIREGKHHLHAALRYIFQLPIHWRMEEESYLEPPVVDESIGF